MGRRAGFLAMLVMAVLWVEATGVAAQSDDATRSSWFTGTVMPASCEDVVPTFEISDEVVRTRGLDCHGAMQATDPRFAGAYLSFQNVDRYSPEGDAPAFSVWTVVRRIENDGGAWQGSPSSGAGRETAADGAEGDVATDTVVFTGEGGYAGLTAVVVFTPFVNAGVRGVIFEGQPPPAASPAA